ncbi:hypothetical protein K501DRAFT_268576 [Backusella circina FSU 941]|nr:hypothetical protein K501DRAFT_268576 [Backusella circina FSU 941]
MKLKGVFAKPSFFFCTAISASTLKSHTSRQTCAPSWSASCSFVSSEISNLNQSGQRGRITGTEKAAQIRLKEMNQKRPGIAEKNFIICYESRTTLSGSIRECDDVWTNFPKNRISMWTNTHVTCTDDEHPDAKMSILKQGQRTIRSVTANNSFDIHYDMLLLVKFGKNLCNEESLESALMVMVVGTEETPNSHFFEITVIEYFI